MTQDVTVESTADVADNDVTVEEVQKQEPDIKDEVEAEKDETESQEDGDGEEEKTPKTVEERLAEIEAKYEEKSKEAEAKQKKIDRQTAAYNDMQKALEKERLGKQEALEKSKAVETQEPDISDFNTHDEWVNALSDWKAEQKISQLEAENAQRREQEKAHALQNERARIANEQEAEYLKVNPRYKASKSEFEGFLATAKVDPQVEDAVVSMAYKGNIPNLIDYFGSNNGERLDEFEKITQMSPIDAAVEIYKIQQKLVTPKKEETKTLTKPVKAPKATSRSKSTKNMTGDEIAKRLNL